MPTYKFTDNVCIYYVANLGRIKDMVDVEFEAEDWFDANRKSREMAEDMVFDGEWQEMEKEPTWMLDFIGSISFEEVKQEGEDNDE